MMISFLACKNESELWKVPIGYQNHEISLGDKYEEINGKIGKLKLDVNSDNSDDVKNYLKIPNEIKIENLQINPIIFLRFNGDELVRFETVYTIDEKVKPMNFQKIIEKLGEGELSEIDELVNMERKSIANNRELWLRRIDIDTISGEYPKIKYRVQVIP
ncbi:hypothetical protein Aoki45_24290 [Algoriphagus sp. oki45]|nr:hypothetical protein Aoki45_24290 [Algoriphagus sp. oki45]